jgi:hypothetical protein
VDDIRSGICPLCRHGEIVAAHAIRDGQMFPLATVRARQGKHSLQSIDPVGAFYACICRSCGYTQFFTWNPEAIPVAEEYGTELLPAQPS